MHSILDIILAMPLNNDLDPARQTTRVKFEFTRLAWSMAESL